MEYNEERTRTRQMTPTLQLVNGQEDAGTVLGVGGIGEAEIEGEVTEEINYSRSSTHIYHYELNDYNDHRRVENCPQLVNASGSGSGGNVRHVLNNAFEVFGHSRCPECEKENCTRPVQESCGHVKCRYCFISNADRCKQCCEVDEEVSVVPDVDVADAKGNLPPTEQRPESKSNIGNYNEIAEGDVDNNEEDDNHNAKEGTRIKLKPNEFVLELGTSGKSGGKTYAVVTSETLKELGLSEEMCGGGSGDVSEDSPVDLVVPKTEVLSNDEEDSADDELGDVNFSPNVDPVPDPVADTVAEGSSRSKKLKAQNQDHIIDLPIVGNKELQPRRYKCTLCGVEFDKRYRFAYHIFCNPKNGKRPYVCETCSEEFTSRSHYEYHVRSKHTGEKPFTCNVCNKKFLQKVKLNRHMKVHNERKPKAAAIKSFACLYCPKKFNHFASCKKHVEMHRDGKVYRCDTCKKPFPSKAHLDKHALIHQKERPRRFQCNQCDRAFAISKDLNRHRLIHTNEYPFVCILCGAKFRRKDNLERHLRNTHTLSDNVAKTMGNEALSRYKASKQCNNRNNGAATASTAPVPASTNSIDAVIDYVIDNQNQ